MARSLLLLSLLALVAAPASRAAEGDGEGAFQSKELNFEIRVPPDSVDWKSMPVDTAKIPTMRVHFRSVFVDTGAYAEVVVHVQKLTASQVREKLETLGNRWKDAMEGNLENAHGRTAELKQFGGVDAFVVDVKGILGTDNHRTNWILCKNGEYLYTIVVNRSGEATKDEDIDAEIKEILASFKFNEILKPKSGKGAGKGDAPEGPAAKDDGKKPTGPAADPEKLKKEKVESSFWRLNFIKPEGLLPEELTQILKDNQIKWAYRGERNTIAMGFRVYVWSTKNEKTFTLDKLLESKIKAAEKRFGSKLKPPTIDKKFKGIPLADDAYRLELLGRSTRTERWIYVMAKCKNDRQYLFEIYTMGDTGSKEWGKSVDELIKSIEPQKD